MLMGMAKGGKMDMSILAKFGFQAQDMGGGAESIQAQVTANEEALNDINTPFAQKLR